MHALGFNSAPLALSLHKYFKLCRDEAESLAAGVLSHGFPCAFDLVVSQLEVFVRVGRTQTTLADELIWLLRRVERWSKE